MALASATLSEIARVPRGNDRNMFSLAKRTATITAAAITSAAAPPILQVPMSRRRRWRSAFGSLDTGHKLARIFPLFRAVFANVAKVAMFEDGGTFQEGLLPCRRAM